MSETPPGNLGFGTILVPLDGSERAERALAPAEQIARATGSRLLLVRVVVPSEWATAMPNRTLARQLYEQVTVVEESAAREYADHVLGTLAKRGVHAEMLIEHGHPASALLDIEAERQIGLVVMATHGRTGLERAALGSVAERIVRGGAAPVLVVRAFGDTSRHACLERAVVALDGTQEAERVLHIVSILAGHLVSHVTLVRVVDPEQPAGASAIAERYLDAARARLGLALTAQGCTVSSQVLYGRVAEQLLMYADGFDVLMLATHAQGRKGHLALGGAVEQVLEGTQRSLLLMRS